MSYSPTTGLVYIPAQHSALKFSQEGIDTRTWQSEEFKGGIGAKVSAADKPPRDYPASLQAGAPGEFLQFLGR